MCDIHVYQSAKYRVRTIACLYYYYETPPLLYVCQLRSRSISSRASPTGILISGRWLMVAGDFPVTRDTLWCLVVTLLSATGYFYVYRLFSAFQLKLKKWKSLPRVIWTHHGIFWIKFIELKMTSSIAIRKFWALFEILYLYKIKYFIKYIIYLKINNKKLDNVFFNSDIFFIKLVHFYSSCAIHASR